MAAPEKILWGASRGQNAYLSGQKSKELPKMADFCHFFPSDWGKVGDRAPHAPPLGAATGSNLSV